MGVLEREAQELMSQIAALIGPPLAAAPDSSEVGLADQASEQDPAGAFPWGGQTAAWSRKGAQEAAEVDAQLSRARRARGEADQALTGAVRDAHAAAHRSQTRLREVLAEIEAGARALQPSLDTPAGRQQLVDLLHRKAQDVTEVIGQAQEVSRQVATVLASAQHGYVTITA
ncbi:DUF4226 domain-containing protein [Mycobacterium heckeshornense]|uniref:DUF4226 domain-containing protein n=1 Tax=Mycobacterium heckeshornense TaxID=110505 RepID=UPI0006628981|nr:DUF4226 domain-containing protein [Mycobacterium heckeshornense]KMV22096.1 hypothetical protein ACT16_13365 [Mycobacterium heckeshornense]